jgi:N-acetylglucosamine-6-sulfatase
MKRVLIAAIAMIVIVPIGQRAVVAQEVQPSVVLILVDDQREDLLSFMPNLQSSLIDQGASFSNAYAGNPLCCPARTSILRGQYPHFTRIYGVAGPYGGAIKTTKFGLLTESLPVWMDRAGYRTAFIGKYLNGYSPTYALKNPVPNGWDYFRGWMTAGAEVDGGYFDYSLAEGSQGAKPIRKNYGSTPDDYSTRVYTRLATEFVNSVPSSEPLFLHLDYHAPHAPFIIDPLDTTAPCSAHPMGPAVGEVDVSDKPDFIGNLPWVASQTSQAQNRWVKRCRMMISVDRGIGSVMAALEAHDPGLDNTMIIYTSDQGISEGEHRWLTKKVAYEESAGIPFVVRYDGVTTPGSLNDRLVTHVDITATATALAGAAVPSPIPCRAPCIQGPMEGVDLTPILIDSTAPWRQDLLIEHYDAPGTGSFTPAYCAMVTESGLKYIRYDPDLEARYEELYDLVADPFELTNVADDPPYLDELAALRTRLQQLCLPTPPDYGF